MSELFVDSVDHWYGEHHVLNNIFVNCAVGEVLGLLGRNGSGKSTLLKIIFGSIKPHHQHLKVNGEYFTKGYFTKKIAYLPQAYFIPHYLKVEVLVQLYTHHYQNQLLAIDVIHSNLGEPIGNLSGGQRRLVEALLIIYSDAQFVLLDEPFSQLAPLINEELKTHITNLKSAKGFIITDHYYQQILAVSSRVVLIHNGSNYKINSEDDLRLHQYLPY